MADMLKRLMTVEVKKAEGENRVLEIAGSTEDKDRMGDIIRADGWKLKPFKANPVFLWAHNYNQPPIGRAIKVWTDKETKRLMFKIEFADAETYEFADTIYKLYVGGFLHATSVGFIPLDWEGKSEEHPFPKWDDNVYTSQELLELSAVPVPANAEALVNARDQGCITVKEFEAITYQEGGIVTKPSVAVIDGIRNPAGQLKIENIEAMRQQLVAEGKDPRYGESPDSVVITEELLAETATCECGKYSYEGVTCDKCGTMVPKSAPEPKSISQEQLADELDYVCDCIELVGLGDTTLLMAHNVVREILRLTGNDIPDDILQKVKDVIGEKQAASSTLPIPDPLPDPVEILKLRAAEVAEVASLVIAKLKGKRIPK